MPPQGVMTSEQAGYNSGLKPIKGHEFRPGTQTRSRDKIPSLSLGVHSAEWLSYRPENQGMAVELLRAG